jgi:ribulose-phosphate 3-epimerase
LVVEAARRVTDLPLDVHLMIVEPDKYLKTFAEAGADHLTVHWEASPHLHRTLQSIRQLGCKPGLAVNPHMPAAFISEIIHMLDIIIVMSVNPGFGGQSFIPESLAKITQLRQMINQTGRDIDRDIDLEVDGGVNVETAKSIVSAGANVLVAGSAVFNSKFSVAEGMEKLRRAAE